MGSFKFSIDRILAQISYSSVLQISTNETLFHYLYFKNSLIHEDNTLKLINIVDYLVI